MSKLVADSFNVPTELVADRYCLRKLEPGVVDMDYDAVMSSKKHLRSVFEQHDDWPRDDMTIAENLQDLRRHESEFDAREAFAYTVLNAAADMCIGCVYIYPPSLAEYDCEVYLWVRTSAADLDPVLHRDIGEWLARCWPFERIAYPGRDIPWQSWHGTPR